MYVLHLSRTALAGVACRYAQFFKKYGTQARSASAVTTSIEFPRDIKVPFHYHPDFPNVANRAIMDESEELREEIKKADIIHIHNYPPLNINSPTWNLIAQKPVILQLHSPPNISKYSYNRVNSKVTIARLLVIAQYQAIQLRPTYPDIIPMRNVIDIDDKLLLPVIKKNNPPIITYAPSNIKTDKKRVGWAYKSIKEVLPLLKQMHNNKSCEFKYIHRVPFTKSLSMRQSANIHIDEVSSGSYHLSSLEGLSQGAAVIANIADWMSDLLKKITGCTTIPWIIANKNNIKSVIKDLLSNKDNLLKRQQESRDWMEKYWNPELILNDYLNIYKETT